MLSIRVARTPPGFAHGDVAKAVWTVIEIADLGQGRSRVSTSMCGWKTGADWDAVYAFFEQGNTIVRALRDYLNKGRDDVTGRQCDRSLTTDIVSVLRSDWRKRLSDSLVRHRDRRT